MAKYRVIKKGDYIYYIPKDEPIQFEPGAVLAGLLIAPVVYLLIVFIIGLAPVVR